MVCPNGRCTPARSVGSPVGEVPGRRMRGHMRGRRSSQAPLLDGQGPLAKVPPVAVFAVVIAVFVAAILVRGLVGAALLGGLAVAVAGLLTATWRVLPAPARAGRVVVLAILVAVAISMLLAK